MNPITFAGCKEIVSFKKDGKPFTPDETTKSQITGLVTLWDKGPNFSLAGQIVRSIQNPGTLLYLDEEEGSAYGELRVDAYFVGPDRLGFNWLSEEQKKENLEEYQNATSKIERFLQDVEKAKSGSVEIELTANPGQPDEQLSPFANEHYPPAKYEPLLIRKINQLA